MAHKVLDLNGVERSTLDLILPDSARTTLRIGMPTEGMVQELQALIPDVQRMENGDHDAVELIYNLGARLMSRNRDLIKVTAEDLRSKYQMDLEAMLLFFSAYMDFINAIQSEKN